MSTSNTKEELLILEDEKEKERIDADIVEQQNLINVENEHKRKERRRRRRIEAAKEVEPKMGENEEQAPPKGVMEKLYDIDNGRYEGEIVKVPFAFYANTKWAGADFWKHDWDTLANMSEEQKRDPTRRNICRCLKPMA